MQKIGLCILASWLLVACGGEITQTEASEKTAENAEKPTEEKPKKPQLEPFPARFTKAEATEGAKNLAKQNNRFAVNFYAKLKAQPEEQNKNLFFSPFSLHTALGMLYEGTSNAGKTELGQVLGVQGLPTAGKDFYNLQGSVLQGLRPNAEIALSNAVWISDQANVLPAYQNAVKENFETEIFKGKLDSPEAIEQINGWVNKNTRGRIPSIIEKDNAPTEDTRLILLNALYFKSVWQEGYAFEAEQTKEEDFKLLTAKKIKVMMMNQFGGSFKYYETPAMQIVGIPYKDAGSYLYVVLPKENTNLPALEQMFTPENLALWLANMKFELAERVAIPKILMQTRFSANKMLQDMGAKAIFEEYGYDHLKGIDDGSQMLFLQSVVHKTFLEINETGSEAAAVTEERVEAPKEEAPREVEKPKKFTFVANRPYMFFIAESNLQTILFMGRVLNPLEK
jgi:serpin B